MDIITYIDTIGRTCFGELVERTKSNIKINAPAMILVTPNDPSNMKVDVMPLFFTEFSSGDLPVFNYNPTQIVEVDVNVSEKILVHYRAKINTKQEPNPEPIPENIGEEVPEVTLFEESK